MRKTACGWQGRHKTSVTGRFGSHWRNHGCSLPSNRHEPAAILKRNSRAPAAMNPPAPRADAAGTSAFEAGCLHGPSAHGGRHDISRSRLAQQCERSRASNRARFASGSDAAGNPSPSHVELGRYRRNRVHPWGGVLRHQRAAHGRPSSGGDRLPAPTTGAAAPTETTGRRGTADQAEPTPSTGGASGNEGTR